MKPTTKELEAAIQVIIAAGAEAYIDPSKVSKAKKFGMGMSKSGHDSSFLLIAAAEDVENWNGHTEAKILRSMAYGRYKFDTTTNTMTLKD